MKSKKAISLIVLVITIIVMIILASAIIISLDNTNIFNKAEEAVDKTNAKANMYLSELKLAERELEKIQGASKVTDATPGELRVEDDTYYIESIEDLVAFSRAVNNGTTYEGKTIKLTRLLDFNSDNSYVNPKAIVDLDGNNDDATIKEELTTIIGFMPIGDGNTSDNQPKKPFKGTFDGDGAEIRNIYINKEDDQRDYYGVGLFGYAEDASFKNIGITGKICTNNNTITGGIVGLIKVISKPIEISNSYSKAEMINAGYCGGLIGEMYGKSEYKSLIQDCYNSGKFIFDKNWEGTFVGGIAIAIDHAIINRCYNLADIDYSSSISSTIGGIVNTLNYSTVLNTYNLGNIKTKDDIAAGIVAYPGRDEIYNSYNIGDIYSDFYDVGGGIIGTAAEVVSNCYNLGNVTNGGAIVGTDGNSTVENVYYIKGRQPIGEITGVGNIINAVEMTESEMKSQKLVDALNANIGDNTEWARWKLGPKGYPVLDI